MLCDKCKFKKFHSGGSFQSVAEGGDDPYDYGFCIFGFWSGGPELEPGIPDPWENCKKYKEAQNAT